MDNSENMEKVRAAMAAHAKAQLAGDLKDGVSIDYTSLEGNQYQGVVVFKKPNMGDYMRMGAIKADYLKKAGVTDLSLVDKSVQFMAHAMATLTVVAIKRPAWLLKLEEVTEPDVIYHVFAKYEEWEDSFRKRVSGVASADSEDSEGTEALDASEAPVRGNTAD